MAMVCSVFIVNRQVPAEEKVFDARDVTFNSRRLWETTGNAQCFVLLLYLWRVTGVKKCLERMRRKNSLVILEKKGAMEK